jgi:5-(aminomethyl)-3-furanmethanol phosphate kinase
MTSGPDAVVKVGGSLCHHPRRVRRLMAALAALAPPRTLVVVPGGGRFADEVRRVDRRFGLDASSAHWMAILGMDQSAYLLLQVAGGGILVRGPGEIRTGRLNILAPAAWLLEADPLPHSWSVTSDSIAAWVARALRARRLVLLKSVAGVPSAGRGRQIPSRILTRATPRQLGNLVDDHFGRALSPSTSCWIVGGANPERVVALLVTGSTYGTEVISRTAARRGRRSREDTGRARPHGRR